MNSYNNVVKMKYTTNNDDVVQLLEYIIFEDSLAEDKYLVFKFVNNLNQRLREIRVDVAFLDDQDNVLGKSIIEYSDFSALEHETFIPSAKLSCDFATTKIHVKLLYARFDNVVFENDTFREIDKKIDSVEGKKKVAGLTPVKASTKRKDKKEVEEVVQKEKIKKIKGGYQVKNVYKRNLARFPKFFNGFIIFAAVAATLGLTFLFSYNSSVISDGDYDYILNTETNSYSIVNYDGDDEVVTIPTTYNGKLVTTLEKGAFDFTFVKKVVYSGTNPLTIKEGAFRNCLALQEITIESNGSIFEHKSISGCLSLTKINAPKSTFTSGAIATSRSFNELKIGGISDGLQLSNIFTAKNVGIANLYINNQTSLSDTYFNDISVHNLYISEGSIQFTYNTLKNINTLNNNVIYHNDSVIYNATNQVIAINETSDVLDIPDSITTPINTLLISEAVINKVKTIKYDGYNSILNKSFLELFTNLETLSVKHISCLNKCPDGINIITEGNTSNNFNNALNGCNINKLNITGGTLGSNAFRYVTANSLVINEGVNASGALGNSSIADVSVPMTPANYTFAGYYSNPTSVTNLKITSNTANNVVPENFIAGLNTLVTLEFDNAVTTYKPRAIHDCTSLTKIKLSDDSVLDYSNASSMPIIYNCTALNNLSLNIANLNKTLDDVVNSANINNLTVYGSTSNSNFLNVSKSINTLEIHGLDLMKNIAIYGIANLTLAVGNASSVATLTKVTDYFTNANPFTSVNIKLYSAYMIISSGFFQGLSLSSIYSLIINNVHTINTTAFVGSMGRMQYIKYNPALNIDSAILNGFSDYAYNVTVIDNN